MKPVPFEQLPDQELVLLARNDRGAMESLVKRYTGAVWHQVRQFQGISEPEDLAQEGFLGLISAVCRYDFMRGVPFSAYAGKCITNSIVSALRHCRNLPLPVGASDMPPLSQVQDTALPPDSVVQSRSQAAEMFCAMVNRLSRREYQVCMLIYGGASYAQAAEQLGISVNQWIMHCSVPDENFIRKAFCSNCTGILRTVSCRRNIFHGTAGKTIPARGIPSGHPRER